MLIEGRGKQDVNRGEGQTGCQWRGKQVVSRGGGVNSMLVEWEGQREC